MPTLLRQQKKYEIRQTSTQKKKKRSSKNCFAKKLKNQKNQMYNKENAELLNGRLAMLGVVAAIGAYAVTGQLIPGFF